MIKYVVVYRAQCKCGWNGPWDAGFRSCEEDAWQHRQTPEHVPADSYVKTEFIY